MSTNTVTTPPADASLSRRGFFMKLGILFNGFAALVLALPVARFLFSSITRGRGNGYLSWVRWETSATFLRERRGWLLFAIPWSCQPMERP
jgi:hypothetical protein